MSGLKLVWECDALAHCIVEHHQGYLYLFTDAPKGGQSVDYHYLLCSPVDTPSNPRKWEVVWNSTSPLLLTCYILLLLHYNQNTGLFETMRYVIVVYSCCFCFLSLLACVSQVYYLTCYNLPHKLQEVFVDDHDLIVEDIDFSDKYLVLIVREGRNFRLCSVRLPLPLGKVKKENLLYHAFMLLQMNS